MKALKVSEITNLNEVINLRPSPDGVNRYRIGEKQLVEIACEIGAVVRVGNRRLIYRPKMDAYFEKIAE